ncbi:hypothetical protein L6164_024651 [Bauhinia variegata]|uniref:Uncharacterized protein n=1 Tax=Bauhinia variegata TaxID=167791 RepID=A0ACB9M0N2_BAUVA|nr:hypothetical protein L6164_024651 [Bauhinia variegata]
METAESECESPAIQALGSLFKLTQIFLRSDNAEVSYSAECPKPAEVDDNDSLEELVPPTEDYSGVLHEDMELTRQMNALGLPLSFQTNKERNRSIKGKRKETQSKQPNGCHNLVDDALSKVSLDEVVSPANFHDKTSKSLSCLSILGQSESSDYDVAVDVDMPQCTSAEGDNLATCPELADAVSSEQNVMHESAINDAQYVDSLISNIIFSDDLKIASTSRTSVGTHLAVAGVGCELEHGERRIGDECLDVSSIVHEDTEHKTICNNDGNATCQQWAHESASFPSISEEIRCDGNADSSYCGEHGDWVVYWDNFYMRNYFYNIKTRTSTWDPPSGLEHLTNGDDTEMYESSTLKATEECGSQNEAKLLEETSINVKLAGQQRDNCTAEIGVAPDNLISDVTVFSERLSIDHTDECLGRNSYNGGVSCCSVSITPDHIISSHGRQIEEAPENNDIYLDELDTKHDPSRPKQKKKVERKRREKRLYNENEGLQFLEMNEDYSATIWKYWCQRYTLFSRFDDGIKMDEEGWFSVTPEPVAWHQALRCAGGILVDCFTGVGGNAIQFAQTCEHVIAIDIDPKKIDYATHNAAIYGVNDHIDFLVGDIFLLAPKLKADTVFLSPPWGGPDYAKVMTYDMKTMLKPHDGYFLFSVAKEIAPRVVMFLPKNINLNQLAELCRSASPPWSLEVEKIFLDGKLKAITAYFSDTAVGGC